MKKYYIVKVNREAKAFEFVEVIRAYDMNLAKRTAMGKYGKEFRDPNVEITVISQPTYRAAFDHGMIVDKNGKVQTIGRNL